MKNKKQIVKSLREVAAHYFNDTFHYAMQHAWGSNPYQFGICYHLDNTEHFLNGANNDEDAYYIIDTIMLDMGENPHHGYFDNKGPDGHRESWSQRAWMCLFLAEYLETKGNRK
jgi:hypothetical protein